MLISALAADYKTYVTFNGKITVLSLTEKISERMILGSTQPKEWVHFVIPKVRKWHNNAVQPLTYITDWENSSSQLVYEPLIPIHQGLGFFLFKEMRHAFNGALNPRKSICCLFLVPDFRYIWVWSDLLQFTASSSRAIPAQWNQWESDDGNYFTLSYLQTRTGNFG